MLGRVWAIDGRGAFGGHALERLFDLWRNDVLFFDMALVSRYVGSQLHTLQRLHLMQLQSSVQTLSPVHFSLARSIQSSLPASHVIPRRSRVTNTRPLLAKG